MIPTYGLILLLALHAPGHEYHVGPDGPSSVTARVGDVIVVEFPRRTEKDEFGQPLALHSTAWNWYMGPTEALRIASDGPRQLYGHSRHRTVVLRCVKPGIAHAEWSLTGNIAGGDEAHFLEGFIDFTVVP